MQTLNIEYTEPSGGRRIAQLPAIDATFDPADQISAMSVIIIAMHDQITALRNQIVSVEAYIARLESQNTDLRDHIEALTKKLLPQVIEFFESPPDREAEKAGSVVVVDKLP